jgi:hypothetical protein
MQAEAVAGVGDPGSGLSPFDRLRAGEAGDRFDPTGR